MSDRKIKIATITWTFGIDNLDDLFATIRLAGFDAVQFCGDHKKYNPLEVIAVSKKYGTEILSYDTINYKPQSNVQPMLENCIQHYSEVIEFAKAINAPMVTLQGISCWTKDIKAYDEAMQFVAEAVKSLNKIAQQYNIVTTYEACNHYELPTVQTAEELLHIHREVNSKNLMLVLDSFHMNITENDMNEALRKAGKLLYSYHVSDSGRGSIGTGHIDYITQYRTLCEIGFEGYVFFEFVLPEIRPNKFPMSEKQMEEFIHQCKYSIEVWKAFAEN